MYATKVHFTVNHQKDGLCEICHRFYTRKFAWYKSCTINIEVAVVAAKESGSFVVTFRKSIKNHTGNLNMQGETHFVACSS